MKRSMPFTLGTMVASCSTPSPALARTVALDIGPVAASILTWAACVIGTVALIVSGLLWWAWRKRGRRLDAMRADFDAEWSRDLSDLRPRPAGRFRLDGLTVPGLAKVIEDLVAVRPVNWEDSRDPQQRAAWRAADAVLAKIGKR